MKIESYLPTDSCANTEQVPYETIELHSYNEMTIEQGKIIDEVDKLLKNQALKWHQTDEDLAFTSAMSNISKWVQSICSYIEQTMQVGKEKNVRYADTFFQDVLFHIYRHINNFYKKGQISKSLNKDLELEKEEDRKSKIALRFGRIAENIQGVDKDRIRGAKAEYDYIQKRISETPDGEQKPMFLRNLALDAKFAIDFVEFVPKDADGEKLVRLVQIKSGMGIADNINERSGIAQKHIEYISGAIKAMKSVVETQIISKEKNKLEFTNFHRVLADIAQQNNTINQEEFNLLTQKIIKNHEIEISSFLRFHSRSDVILRDFYEEDEYKEYRYIIDSIREMSGVYESWVTEHVKISLKSILNVPKMSSVIIAGAESAEIVSEEFDIDRLLI